VRAHAALVDSFAGIEVLVVGDAMLDSFIEGSSSRLCPEGPVPVVDVERRADCPGGAANVAANVAALGGRATLLSVVGDDSEGALLRSSLEATGASCRSLAVDPARRTLVRRRVVSDSQLLVRVDEGTRAPLAPHTERSLVTRLEELFQEVDAVIISDYGYGVLGSGVVHALSVLPARAPRLVAVDAKDLSTYRRVGVTLAKPNYGQLAGLVGADSEALDNGRVQGVVAVAPRVLDAIGADVLAVTLDRDGAVICERGRPAHRTFASAAPSSRSAGAGDTFLCALALALAAGAHTPAAAEIASRAAAIVVAQARTATCGSSELRAALAPESHKCVSGSSELAAALKRLRRGGRRVVFTNGCFDILHRGHISYLARARSLGDALVVGVNSDASVTRLKGPGRPVNGLEDRMEVLAALSSVDLVVAFEDDTPIRLIEAVSPEVFVKGGDYTREMLPEAATVEACGGEVHILDLVADTSTTGIVERIRAASP
jgi:D-beta-D-heptose 7-phosphate kinase/D-beta-D-heptose 1-phosphate adenosyltransferase